MTNGLKIIRERAGLTQQQAADKLGLSKSGYVKIEGGARKLSDHRIRDIMRAFGANAREVMGERSDQALPPKQTPAQPPMTPYAEAPQRELTPEEAVAFARACMLFLEQNADETLANQWLEALLEDLRQHDRDEDLQNLEVLRTKVRTVSKLVRAGLLARSPRRS